MVFLFQPSAFQHYPHPPIFPHCQPRFHFSMRASLKTNFLAAMQTPLIFVAVFLALVGVGQAPAQEQSVQSGVNDQYQNPNPDEWETESREIFSHREKIAAACGLKPGMSAADIGAGTGLFTRLLAEPEEPGKVLKENYCLIFRKVPTAVKPE
jgi:hypothetical protein